MRILAVSRAFLPNLGGLETAADALTRAWVEAGHEVTIATETPGDEIGRRGLTVLRRPSPLALFAATRWADLVWHNHVSLRAAWTLALAPRPWVVTHQGWLRHVDGRLSLAYRAKRLIAGRAHSVAISAAMAADLPAPATVIPNPYRDRLFRDLRQPRPFELAFLGRFVSDKGAALNSAVVLVVPSLYHEPLGIVALEGIACGCAVIASAGGGLPEAVGPCGVTFPNGDVEALTRCIAELLDRPERRETLLGGAAEHLAGFTAAAVARRYLALFEAAVRREPY